MAPRRNSNNNGSVRLNSSSSSNSNNSNSNNTASNNNYFNKSNSSGSSSASVEFVGNSNTNNNSLNIVSTSSSVTMTPMPTPSNASASSTLGGGGGGGAHHQQQQQQQHHLNHHNSNSGASNGGVLLSGGGGGGGGVIVGGVITISGNNAGGDYTRCCYPNGECCKLEPLILLDELSDCVRVVCNNENCNVGQYMHRECFESWEQAVLVALKANGRARSWSERQRMQNLWTKKGYDLVYKACNCKCGRGHLRKDLDWTAPQAGTQLKNGFGGQQQQQQQRVVNGGNISGPEDDDKKKNKKKRNRNNNQKTTLALATLNGNANAATNGTGGNNYHHHQQQQQQQQQQHQQQQNNANTANIGTLAPNPNVGVIGSGLPHNNNNNNNNNGNNTNNQRNDSVANINNMNNNLQSNVVNTLSSIVINGGVVGNSSGNVLGLDLRARAGSLSSSGAGSGSSSPSASQSSSVDMAISPTHQQHHQLQQQQQQQQQQQLQQQQLQQQQQHQQQVALQQQQQLQQSNSSSLLLSAAWLSKSILNGIDNSLLKSTTTNSGGCSGPAMASITNFKPLTSYDQQQLMQQQKNKEVELYSERVRSTSGCNGIFSRRLDFSSFNLLPKTRLNSYQVKIEDEGNHGNDETRLFILSSLAQSQMSRVACILCEEPLLVFDRYPLVDGSFFLSPKQHSTGCIEVKYEGRTLYLTCVCMSCLDGTSSNRIISCRFCSEPWDGSNLVLGTMYAYDIFAAMPCCAERFKCNNCFKLLMHPQQRLSFYSDYSHGVTCPYCNSQDTHFVKSLSYCYIKSQVARGLAIA